MPQFNDEEILSNQQRMESNRSQFDSLRDEIAALVLPSQRGFHDEFLSQGDERTQWQYDPHAAQALEDGEAAFGGFVDPNEFVLEFPDEEMNDNVEARQWLEMVTKRLLKLRDDPGSGWVAANSQSRTSLLGFGEQSMWVDIRYDPSGAAIGLSYQSEHVSQIYVERDAEGNPMRVHKKFMLSAEQALNKWGNKAPPMVKEAMAETKPNRAKQFEFIHIVEPNRSRKRDLITADGMPLKACHFSCADRMAFETGGYWTMPRTVSCFVRSLREDYGRSRAMTAMPTIRAIQVMMQMRVLGVERGVRPTLLAMDDDLDQQVIDFGPDGIIWGGLDERGNPTLQQLYQQLDNSSAENLHAQLYTVIDKAFYKDLLQIHRELKTHISAVRTMEEISEKGLLMDPMARQETDWYAAMLPRELQLMEQLGWLSDMPDQVAAYLQDGGKMVGKYDNQLARMRESKESVGYMRTAEQVGLVSQFDPQAAVYFRRAYPLERAIKRLGHLNGIPASWHATPEELAEFDEQQSISEQTEQLLTMMPTAAAATKDIASASRDFAQGGNG